MLDKQWFMAHRRRETLVWAGQAAVRDMHSHVSCTSLSSGLAAGAARAAAGAARAAAAAAARAAAAAAARAAAARAAAVRWAVVVAQTAVAPAVRAARQLADSSRGCSRSVLDRVDRAETPRMPDRAGTVQKADTAVEHATYELPSGPGGHARHETTSKTRLLACLACVLQHQSDLHPWWLR